MKNADKPAYPVHGGGYYDDDPRNHTIGGGLTKREYFAAMAMQGMLASLSGISSDYSQIAHMAIEQADELLKQLES